MAAQTLSSSQLSQILANIGDVVPNFGRQFGFHLEHLSFSVSAATIHWIGLLLMGIGTVSGNYVLHLFNTRDFAGMIPNRNYYGLHILVLLVSAIYVFVM